MRTNDALELAIGVLADLVGDAEHTSRKERQEAIALLRQLQQQSSEQQQVMVVVHTFEDGDHDAWVVGRFPCTIDDWDEDGEQTEATIHDRAELVAWGNRAYGEGDWELFDQLPVLG